MMTASATCNMRYATCNMRTRPGIDAPRKRKSQGKKKKKVKHQIDVALTNK